ncbi:MAG: nitric oxide reductase activation protein [Magnetococcales bacterium]|nr:nitric oxide reductase activation protein [Magnetococcales bacterium]
MQPSPEDVLEEHLEEMLQAALSSRRTVLPIVQILSRCSPAQQQKMLHWLPILARINPELAFQCGMRVPPLLDQGPDLDGWLGMVIDRYDRDGLQQALALLRDGPPGGSGRSAETAFLAEMSGLLHTFVTALGGRPLQLAEGEQPYTDTETLFLPAALTLTGQRQENGRLYHSLVAHLWGLGRFGTFFPQLPQWLARHPDPERAAGCYLALEAYRVDAILGRLLPGLARVMAPWQAARPASAAWQQAARALAAPSASREESGAWIERLYDEPRPPPLPFHSAPLYRPALLALQNRLEREKTRFRTIVGQMLWQREPIPLPDPGHEPHLEWRPLADGLTVELSLDGQPLLPPQELHNLSRSILQDLGHIPPEYLTASGAGGYAVHAQTAPAGSPHTPAAEAASASGIHLYDEWDFHRADYRKGWCVLKECSIQPSTEPIVAATLEKYGGVWQVIQRSFALLRGGDAWLRRQAQGDELDMEALVQALVDTRIGLEMGERLYRRRQRYERDVATLLLVDMSGSTKGWIMRAIQESVVLLCKALQVLGDRHAVYGFSSRTRKHCEWYAIQSFEHPDDPAVEGRIAGILPMEYTRMGVFIRHATTLLNRQEAKTRLLITLSDGKPEDYDGFYDGYRGQYAIEDTRKALIEARRSGIHPFCITIDSEARDYLPRLYGPARFVVLDDVRQLPVKIADIYRRLTT